MSEIDESRDRIEAVGEEALELARTWLETGAELAASSLTALARGLRATADGVGRLGEALEEPPKASE